MEDAIDNEIVVTPAETEARQFGWVPKDEFSGNDDDWKDADTFLKRGREINGFLRKDLEKIKDKLSTKDRELQELRETMQEFKKFHEQTSERAYTRALEELKEQKKQAIADADGELVVAIDDQIDEIKTAQKKIEVKPKPVEDRNIQVLNDWLTENSIFASDIQVRAMANGLSDVVRAETNLVGKEFLEEVAKRTREVLPQKFENPSRGRPSAVGTNNDAGSPRGVKKKSYVDLPADAKEACDMFVKQGLLTKEKYVKEYFDTEE